MFRPIIPLPGLGGWRFLERTYDTQRATFDRSAELVRDSDYFAVKIGQVASAADLVADRRLLRVALGAFGLQDDLNSRALIRKVLEDGTTRSDALANRLSDNRYRSLSRAFGFGDAAGSRVAEPGFAAGIIAAYRARSFEVAVGEQDNGFRLALNAKRDLAEVATAAQSEDTKWFRIMGSPPLRQVIQTALGLPDSFAQLDIDRQLEVFKDRSAQQLGLASLAALADPVAMDRVIQRFLLRTETAAASSSSPQATALLLLGG